ncbi:hypothetical protein CEXT_420201 [Caerostris extrusa]|uniref:EGF-like domain-containing protein n=1 Tax=Caerostris extrusa TaxID=172846 RepID=A0AAV4STB8_CAEEX|nr:hypothetical protein CEXT_420201 [Caerostris extrusa]
MQDTFENDGICKQTCIADDECGNSGTCQKRGDSQFCDCKPGITGDKCEVIDDCVNGKYKDCSGEKGICVYDQKDEKALVRSGNIKCHDDKENICRAAYIGGKFVLKGPSRREWEDSSRFRTPMRSRSV